MLCRSIMVQGTSSNAGKSAIVTGLCRLFRRQGFKVCPFKPQNMSLNSAVTIDGGEIGRAQSLQAQACGIEPHTDMNPVLLKPSTVTGAQVIVHGKVLTDMDAASYHQFKPKLLPAVLESYQRLASRFDIIVIEGAGSPAEINLRDGDIANMGFALAVQCPVLLVADIDRGGVFAQIAGTMLLLSEAEQELVKGFIINKFRGDLTLLQSGIKWLEEHTGKPVLGVLPYLDNFLMDAEDSLSRNEQSAAKPASKLRIIVPLLPHISNHTDFEPLVLHPSVDLQFVGEGGISAADLIILPGSKSVCDDLQWLIDKGWHAAIMRHLRYGGKVLGICGGFQMLGRTINDPLAVESATASIQALGIFDMETTMAPCKQLKLVTGKLLPTNAAVQGYEIHMGISTGAALLNPAIVIEERSGAMRYDGALSQDGQIMGTYLHGLFDNTEACAALLAWSGLKSAEQPNYHLVKENNINRLADVIENHLDFAYIKKIIEIDTTSVPIVMPKTVRS